MTEQRERIAVAEFDEHFRSAWSAIWPKGNWAQFLLAIQGLCEQFTKQAQALFPSDCRIKAEIYALFAVT